MKFDRNNKSDLCYYGQVNLLRIQSSVASKMPSRHLWEYHLFCWRWNVATHHDMVLLMPHDGFRHDTPNAAHVDFFCPLFGADPHLVQLQFECQSHFAANLVHHA